MIPETVVSLVMEMEVPVGGWANSKLPEKSVMELMSTVARLSVVSKEREFINALLKVKEAPLGALITETSS